MALTTRSTGAATRFGTGAGIVLSPAGPRPPGPFPAIVPNGGPIIRNIQANVVFWGDFWSGTPAPSAQDITTAFATIVTGPYLDGLNQYEGTFGARIGRGTIANALVVNYAVGNSPADPPLVFSDADVTNFISDLIAAGILPSPAFTPDAVYWVVLPPACQSANNTPAITIVGEHGWQPLPSGLVAVWAWVTTSTQVLDDVTEVCSHELAEVCTDPFLNAWHAPLGTTLPGFPPNSAIEICDECQPERGTLNGVVVQAYRSQRDGDCIIPVAQLPLQPAPPGFPAPPGVDRDGWIRSVPDSTGGPCVPQLNPDVASFRNHFVFVGNVIVEGVRLQGFSSTAACCSCIAETKRFPLLDALNTDDVDLRAAWFAAQRGNDQFSLCSLGIRLLMNNTPIAGAEQICVAELGRTNNCAGAYGAAPRLLTNNAPFVLWLHDIASNTTFNGIEIALLSYACEPGVSNALELGGLQLTLHQI